MRYLEEANFTESKTEVTKGWRNGRRGLLFNGYGVSVWDNEKVLETDSGDDCTTL